MANVEWEAVQDIVTPAGTIPLNQPDPITNRWFMVQQAGYKIVPSLRIVQDNVSQADGSILHPRYKTGLVATMTVLYAIREGGIGSVDYTPACAKDLREMHEQLTKALDSIRRQTQNTQRYLWTPSNGGSPISRRMLDFIQCLAWSEPTYDQTETFVTFALETPLPYAIDLTQITTALTATVTNPGSSSMKPVLKVHGPFSTFAITNTDDLDEFGNAKSLIYDASLPGAQVVNSGHYAEIDMFRGTIFLDGNSADLTAGLDPTLTDFWSIKPGSNDITSDTPCDMLWNPSWS
jgi:hypothetical protein